MYINTSRKVGCPDGSDSLPLVKLGLFLSMPLSLSASDELFFAPLHPFPVLFGFSLSCPQSLPSGIWPVLYALP